MRLYMVLATAVLILAATAFAGQRHYDRANGFSIQIPPGWSRKTDPLLAVKNSNLTLHRGRLRVAVMTFPGGTVKQMMKAYNTPMKEEGAKKTLDRATVINKVQGWITVWEIGADGVIFIALQSGDRGYILIGRVPPGGSENAGAEAGKLMTTFRVERDSVPAPASPPAKPTKSPSKPVEIDKF